MTTDNTKALDEAPATQQPKTTKAVEEAERETLARMIEEVA